MVAINRNLVQIAAMPPLPLTDKDVIYIVQDNGTKDRATNPKALAGYAALRQQVYNAKDYGALGNGIADDTPAIQAAITAAGAVGGTVLLPAGTYRLTSTLVLPNYTHLVGSGKASVTTLKAAHALPVVVSASYGQLAGSTTNIIIEDLTVDGQNTASLGIGIGNSHGLSFRNRLSNVQVGGCTNGIDWQYSVYSTWRDVYIHGRDVAGSVGVNFPAETQSLTAINVQVDGFGVNCKGSGSGLVFMSCQFYAEATYANVVNLVELVDCYQSHFIDCVFENIGGSSCVTEVRLHETAGAAWHTTNIAFDNCRWLGPHDNVVRLKLGDATKTVYKTSLSRCVFIAAVGSVDIDYSNSESTVVEYCSRITGYSGTQITAPTVTGVDGGYPLVLQPNLVKSQVITGQTVNATTLANLQAMRLTGVNQGALKQKFIPTMQIGDVVQLLDVTGFALQTASILFIINGTAQPAIYAVRAGSLVCSEMSDPAGVYSTVKDTATSTNLYYDAGLGYYVLQNNSAYAQYYTILIFQNS